MERFRFLDAPISTAQLQGLFIMNKDKPLDAIKNIGALVETR